jgi:hypothetical protein
MRKLSRQVSINVPRIAFTRRSKLCLAADIYLDPKQLVHVLFHGSAAQMCLVQHKDVYATTVCYNHESPRVQATCPPSFAKVGRQMECLFLCLRWLAALPFTGLLMPAITVSTTAHCAGFAYGQRGHTSSHGCMVQPLPSAFLQRFMLVPDRHPCLQPQGFDQAVLGARGHKARPKLPPSLDASAGLNAAILFAAHSSARTAITAQFPPFLEAASMATDGTLANGPSGSPCVSGDGRYAAFLSAADNLVPDDTNGLYDAFVYDRETSKTVRVNLKACSQTARSRLCPLALTGDTLLLPLVAGSLLTTLTTTGTCTSETC